MVPILHGGKGRLLREIHYLWQMVPGLPTPTAWWQPKADSYGLWVPPDIATSYVNVANPGTYDAAPGTAPAWAAATGWTFTAASSQYLTTGLVPTCDQTWTLLVCGNTWSGTGSSYIMAGSFDTAAPRGYLYLQGNNGLGSRGYTTGTKAVSIVGAVTAGTMAVAGLQPYLDGAPDGVPIAVGPDTGGVQLFLGAVNANGGASTYLSGVETLVAAWNTNIAAYIAALYTVLQGAGLTV